MKLTTTAAQLRTAMSLVKPLIERRNTYPVLACVLIDGRTLTATNLDQIITVEFAAKRAKGRAAIDAHSLSRILAHIPAEDVVRIEADNEKAVLEFGTGRYELTSLNPDGFPILDWHTAKPDHEPVTDVWLKNALEFVRPAISNEETRYYLNGVHFGRDRQNREVLVATNGRTLASHLSGHWPDWLDGKIMPTRAVDLLRKHLDGPTLSLVGETHLRFEWPGVTLSTKLIEGTYPDWQRVVPEIKDDHPSIVLDAKPLNAALRRLSGLWAKRGSHSVSLAFNERGLAIVGKHYDGPIGIETLPHKGALVSGHISFNIEFLKSALRQLNADEPMELSFADYSSPAQAFNSEGDGFFIIMPIRGGEDELALAALDAAFPAQMEAAE